MLILGIESTCDETAAAVVRDGKTILSNCIVSQIELHRPFGGVVPELASRSHLEAISPIIRLALQEASCSIEELDAIAVAHGPGLVGALLVGLNTAKGMAMALQKPLIGINHIEAHLYAAIMGRLDEVSFPALGVVISGGHTALVKICEVGTYERISTTVDDAIGEAFDKVASMMHLPYPGGPEIEKLALEGDPTHYSFRAGRVKNNPLAFSFSGLKTSLLYTIRGMGGRPVANPKDYPDIAAAFQEAALGDIVKKSLQAAEQYNLKAILFGGGVTNNNRLKALFSNAPLPLFWPPAELTLDNAAMIAALAYEKAKRDDFSPLSLQADPRLKFAGA